MQAKLGDNLILLSWDVGVAERNVSENVEEEVVVVVVRVVPLDAPSNVASTTALPAKSILE